MISSVAPSTMRRTDSGICIVVSKLVMSVSTSAPAIVPVAALAAREERAADRDRRNRRTETDSPMRM